MLLELGGWCRVTGGSYQLVLDIFAGGGLNLLLLTCFCSFRRMIESRFDQPKGRIGKACIRVLDALRVQQLVHAKLFESQEAWKIAMLLLLLIVVDYGVAHVYFLAHVN